jgi:GcrA cell cycle regulator
MTSNSWDVRRVDTLTQLWKDGLSASEIAQRLSGVTRNAVLGKLHRLGLLGRRSATSKAKPPRAPRLRRPGRSLPPPCPEPVRSRPSEVPDLPGLVPCLDCLGPRACHWPIGDPQAADFAFCGRRVQRGSYCDDHAHVAYRPFSASKRVTRTAGRGLRLLA